MGMCVYVYMEFKMICGNMNVRGLPCVWKLYERGFQAYTRTYVYVYDFIWSCTEYICMYICIQNQYKQINVIDD